MFARRTIVLAATLMAAMAVHPGTAAAQFGLGDRWLGAHVGVSGVGSAAALGVNGEVAYRQNIGIGAWLDTWSYGDAYGTGAGRVNWDVRYISVAGTGAYHFPIESSPKLDPFLGLALGYFVVSSEARGSTGVTYGGDASRIFLGGYGGARYKFKENLAGLARVGFGAAYLTVGVDVKL